MVSRVFIVLVSILVSMLSVDAFAAVGRTAGSFNVSSFTGSAQYAIPILTPPGVHGLQPKLALTYDSQVGYGMMGPGWSLSGLSTISRCNRTYAQHGTPAAVTLTYADAFCLDGNHLRLTSSEALSTYGQIATTYQTEIANFSNVLASPTLAGNGPSYFTVKGADGLTYEYGNTTDSKILPAAGAATPYIWALDKVTDRSGNTMTFTYIQSNGTFVPSTITYGGYGITFTYSPASNTSTLFLAVAGTQTVQTNQLATIRTYDRTYTLNYTNSGSTYRATLTSIQECGSGPDCLPPTNIVYQNSVYGSLNNGTLGITNPTTATGSGATNGKVYSVDIDGDGKQDLIFATTNSNGYYQWWVQFATGTGYSLPVNTGAVTSGITQFLIDNFAATTGAGSAGQQILAAMGGYWTLFTWNPVSGAFVSTPTGVAVVAGVTYSSADVNGDGLADLVYSVTSSSGTNNAKVAIGSYTAAINVQLNTNTALTGVSPGVLSFAAPVTTNYFNTSGFPLILIGNNQLPSSSIRHFDFDGDGRDDLIISYSPGIGQPNNTIGLLSRGTAAFVVGPSLSVGGATAFIGVANWNDDACTDLVVGSTVQISSCNGSVGTTFTLPSIPSLALDWDGDGRTDLLANVGGTWKLYQSLGASSPQPTAVATGISVVGSGAYIVTDADGDGLHDLAFVNSTAGNAIYYGLHNGAGVHPDLATSITDAYGDGVNLSYVSTAQSNYTPRNSNGSLAAQFPYREYNEPLYVARQAIFIGPNGHTETYTYKAAWLNLQGRGYSGFGTKTTNDSRWGEFLYDSHWREFPFTGMPAEVKLTDSYNDTISDTQIVPNVKYLDQTANNQRYFPFNWDIQKSLSEPGTNLTGPYSFQDTSYAYDNYGNATAVTTTLTDESSVSPFTGEQWTTTTTSTFTPYTPAWCLGLPTEVTVTNTDTLPGSATSGPITRTVSYNNPDYLYCRQTEKVIEPNSATYKVVEDFYYDAFGNLQTDTVTGVGMAARTTQLNWGTTGQFLIGIQNPLLQSVALGYDIVGNLTSSADPNSTAANPLVTTWQYDSFDRKILESRPDGTSTTWSYNDCATNGCVDTNFYLNPYGNHMMVTETVLNAGGTTQSVHNEYLDGLDRPLVVSNLMLNGAYDRTDFTYDGFGNIAGQSPPCTFVGCTTTVSNQSSWTTYLHDELNRLTNITRPVSATNSAYQSTLIGYQGLRTDVTDALNNTTTHDQHVTGQLGRSVDATAQSYTQLFYYDAFGSLLSVKDNFSNTLFTATYDYGIQAFQRNATDMDLDVSTLAGQHRAYNYDALGELTSWSDAKGQSFSMTYDQLSRPYIRTEPDLTTTWNWGNSAGSYNIGRLASVTASGSTGTYLETYTYDSKTRPWVKVVTIPGDATYAYTSAYNVTTGFLDTLTYPASTSGYQLKLQYGYAKGLLKTISDFNAPSTVFWTVNATNPRGQVTQETLGNGVVINRSLDAITGWLGGVQAGVGGGAALQNAGFLYDFVGNVSQRQNSNLGLTENFFYDADYRLNHSTLNNVVNLQMTYDTFGIGNITSRSDVAGNTSWTYDPVRKHAVTQAGTGGNSYTYDNNGNAKTRNGYPISWTSYNYPSSVASSGESAQFWYGPDRQRYKTLYTGGTGIETTYHVGHLLEKVVSSGITDYRHAIFAGNERVAIYSRTSAGTNTLRYVLNDHQASVASIVSNSTPGPVANYVTESFSAFGNRRSGTTWSGAPTPGDETLINGVSRDGYTGQTTLGVSMGLNHLNGRVQDAITGRFLSPDPYVPNPGNTQSFNRYSYVNNNPLSLVDPTGFDGEGGGDFLGDYTVYGNQGGWFADGWAGPRFACPCSGGRSLNFPTQGQATAQSTDIRSKPATDTSDSAVTAVVFPSGLLDVSPELFNTFDIYSLLGKEMGISPNEVGTIAERYPAETPEQIDGVLVTARRMGSDSTFNFAANARDPELIRRNPLHAASETVKFGINGALVATSGFTLFRAVKGIFSAARGLAPVARGGASIGNIAASDALRIQNAANRIGQQISLVGSRAGGTATTASDWDYVINGSSKALNSVSSSLPGAGNISEGLLKNLDIFRGDVWEGFPSITFFPGGP